MSFSGKTLLIFISIISVFLFYDFSIAQLSPGDLNEVHSDLEGLANCEKCHEAARQVSSSRCLECHEFISAGLKEHRGFHGANEYSDCVVCHVEHLGKDSELIFWEDGRENFDHSLAGYKLEGKHKSLDCRSCHQKRNISNPQSLIAKKKSLDRTFMGLTTGCLGCHGDEHRAQLTDNCQSCHSYDSWKPAGGFSHDNVAFKLEGKHRDVTCVKCHPIITDNFKPDDIDYMKFTAINHENCLSCHEDVHRNKFGTNCEQCHNVSGWRIVSQADFDHSKTRYPLQGKHAEISCEKCHEPGKPKAGLRYAQCSDCHTDYHLRQFASRDNGGACDGCHSVYGFRPALYGIRYHGQTDFPLKGGHLATPCIACHTNTYILEGKQTQKFTFTKTTCITCHNDPHRGEVNKYLKVSGCRYCHNEDSWRAVSFDHAQAGFTLEGRHLMAQCVDCHKSARQSIELKLMFTGLDKSCQSCHDDIHGGQFADSTAVVETKAVITSCNNCHDSQDWLPRKFNHDRAAFKLEGAHKQVECSGCHKKIKQGEREFTWFKPLEKTCVHCHGGKYSGNELGDS